MIKTINISLAASIVLALAFSVLLFGAQYVSAATDYANSNESFTQGLKKNGDPVDVARSDETEALGAPDGDFVSLGYGGELILGFPLVMGGDLTLSVQEITGGSYPLETADVYVSENPVGPWVFVGEATNDEGVGDGITTFNPEQCYRYVRILDTTNENLHNSSSDGFDVDAVESEYTEECQPEPEPEPCDCGGDDIIINKNKGKVKNVVISRSSTGGNSAGGSTGGNGGNGGSVINNGYEEEEGGDANNNTTGRGGAGGRGGTGGFIQTGAATAIADVMTRLNINLVRISR